MARVVTYELVGCGWDVLWEDAPDIDLYDGQQRYSGNGELKTKRVAVLRLIDTDPSEGQAPRFHRIVFDDENRRRLIEKLSGGISLHVPGDVPQL